jgi:hypothetical protein
VVAAFPKNDVKVLTAQCAIPDDLAFVARRPKQPRPQFLPVYKRPLPNRVPRILGFFSRVFSGFVVLGILDCGQALLKSADVGRIVSEGVIGKARSAGEILREKFGDCFLREAKVGEAFAIRFADKMVCALHHALTFFEPFDFIDELRLHLSLSLRMYPFIPLYSISRLDFSPR